MADDNKPSEALQTLQSAIISAAESGVSALSGRLASAESIFQVPTVDE